VRVSAPIRILGIDPGLNRTGYGVIDVRGDRLQCVDAGVIRVPPGELAPRLGVILQELAKVIAAHGPSIAVVEQVFVNVNAKSTLLLGQARGAALCAVVSHGLVVHEYSATSVKKAVVGTGRAGKAQVQDMLRRLLALSAMPQADAADALACAVCHAHTRKLQTFLTLAATSGNRSLSGPASGRRSGNGRSAWTARAIALGK
jgi:crossover junction endodeoxyribonuclease RuvC